MPQEKEQRDGHAPKCNKLRVRARHAIALARDAGGARLLYDALEEEVCALAGELAGEEEENLGLAGGEEEGCVDYY